MLGTRELKAAEYLKVLQLEYLTHRVRSKIFDRPEFIKMAIDIAAKKKETILELEQKYFQPTIFTSFEGFQTFWEKEFLNATGLPNLQYTLDPRKAARQHLWDKKYILAPGTLVFYNGIEHKVKINNAEGCWIDLVGGMKHLSYDEIQIKSLIMCFDGTI